jgi:hypothetical protein
LLNNILASEPDRKPRKSTSEKSEPIRTGSSSVKAIRTQIDANEIKEKTIGAWSLPIRVFINTITNTSLNY